LGSCQTSFICTQSKGAVLSLPYNAHREDTPHADLFRAYAIKHCESWFDFALAAGLEVERMEDLLLVTGCDRTQPWSLAAFTESDAGPDTSANYLSLLGGIAFAHVLKWNSAESGFRYVPSNRSHLSYVKFTLLM
jgi:hypothetical protein